MTFEWYFGLFAPLIGTVLGAGGVFFLRREMRRSLQRALMGFAAGVMVAASVWSLIIPSIESCEQMGKWSVFPAGVGLLLGFGFLLLLDRLIPHLHVTATDPEGPRTSLGKSTMLVLAVALHNLPEGMAVGVLLAGVSTGSQVVSPAALVALSLGIALQNFPEGAIISMPLSSTGMKRSRAFVWGALSGVVEPIGALFTLLFASFATALLPYLLCFAAGAMLYVVVEELIPEMSEGEHSHIGTVAFCLGFVLMMVLDVVLG